MGNAFTRYQIEDRSYAAFIKKEIRNQAAAAGFNSIEGGKIDIIVSELTSNLVKHAGGGELLYRVLPDGPTFEIICIDKGLGIKDIPRAMKDGVSTTKTLGQGLGSMERLSTVFQVFSLPDWGTIIYSSLKIGKNVEKRNEDMEVRSLLVPKLHEEFCGDGYAIVHNKSHTKILFGDGLGHGKHAFDAVEAAKDFFLESREIDPVGMLRGIHDRVKRTRGLVASVAVLNKETRLWSLCGIGNIMTRIYSGIEYRSYMGYNGTVGLNVPRSMKATEIPAERNQHLIMCSDGITTRWNLNKYPYIFKYDPLVMASAIYKDFARGTDDASVFIAKGN